MVENYTVQVDNSTIKFNSLGQLQAIVTAAGAIAPITISDGEYSLSYDDATLVLNSSNQLVLNTANANTWTGLQTFVAPSSGGNVLAFMTQQLGPNAGGISYLYYYELTDGPNYLMAFQFILQPNLGPSNIAALSINENGNGSLSSVKNTLDDGSGNMSIAGVISTTGVKTTAGAATTITVGASPFTYSNTSASNQQLFIQGGTVSAITFNPNGGTGIPLNEVTNVLVLRPGDTVTVTYTVAPTMTTIQL